MEGDAGASLESRETNFTDFTYPYRPYSPQAFGFKTLGDNLPAPKLSPVGVTADPCVSNISATNVGNFGSPSTNLSVLDVLPPEIVQNILVQLDIRSITDFAYVNRLARRHVNAIPEYKAISTHANHVLRAILAIETGRWIECGRLYEKLCTAECDDCGDFGGYLYLVTCKRVCKLCLIDKKLYRPRSPYWAGRNFAISQKVVRTLPCMLAFPGKYTIPLGSHAPYEVTERFPLVDAESAFRAGIAGHGSEQAMDEEVSAQIRRMSRCRTLVTNEYRCLAVIRAPWLDKSSKELVEGRHCVGCTEHSFWPLHRAREYSAKTFEKHLHECGRITRGRHQGENYKQLLDRTGRFYSYSGREND